MYAENITDLSDYTEDDDVGIEHVPELQHLFAKIDINKQMVPALLGENNPFRVMIEEARARAIEATEKLVEVDPFAPNAMHDVASLQNTIRRFSDMIKWIGTYSALGDEAAREVRQIERGQ